ncbi:hypothetical protein N7516_002753 [Penicillium verrucosum]|uniref:uncharacterized protein n=1 Tax=Penicillium verrucosum TaxID=60171 RepID=UPI002544E12C|nr:uncharacterized protein N7516_002753 [Penicillium verrucosum]KAJ5942585.1 hypothetical protein N7516_002753 [Penicillium verrucosum]
MEPFVLSLLVLLPVIVLVQYAFTYGHRISTMPTGPPTLPFIGNIHQITKKYTHIKFTEWAAQYGGLYMLKIGNGNMAVITDRRLVKEVLDRKSGIYSHRPHSFVSHDLITKGNHLLVMHYGDQWRTFRRLVHQHFMETMVDSHQTKIVNAEAIQLVRDYMISPEHHMAHPKRYSNSITNSIVFGIRTANRKGSNMRRLYKLMEEWSEVMETGATPPVDLFPWLKLLPQWLFNNYINRAKSIGVQMETLYVHILNKVIKRREEGRNNGTFMDKVLDSQEKHNLPWHQLAFIGGVLMEGGSDTTSSLTLAIVQALIQNPDVQRKAHAEIDAVVGHNRRRQGHLFLLFFHVLSFEFDHLLTSVSDDWVDGKFLPKGTTVVVNTWGIHMDPSQPDDPTAFIPERFANHPHLAPDYVPGTWERRDHYGYGVGRRICPGIHLAERNMFLAIAKLVWAFDFQPGEGSVDSDPVSGYHNGFLYCAKDYPCRPVVRNEIIRATIEREYATATTDVFSMFTEG